MKVKVLDVRVLHGHAIAKAVASAEHAEINVKVTFRVGHAVSCDAVFEIARDEVLHYLDIA